MISFDVVSAPISQSTERIVLEIVQELRREHAPGTYAENLKNGAFEFTDAQLAQFTNDTDRILHSYTQKYNQFQNIRNQACKDYYQSNPSQVLEKVSLLDIWPPEERKISFLKNIENQLVTVLTTATARAVNGKSDLLSALSNEYIKRAVSVAKNEQLIAEIAVYRDTLPPCALQNFLHRTAYYLETNHSLLEALTPQRFNDILRSNLIQKIAIGWGMTIALKKPEFAQFIDKSDLTQFAKQDPSCFDATVKFVYVKEQDLERRGQLLRSLYSAEQAVELVFPKNERVNSSSMLYPTSWSAEVRSVNERIIPSFLKYIYHNLEGVNLVLKLNKYSDTEKILLHFGLYNKEYFDDIYNTLTLTGALADGNEREFLISALKSIPPSRQANSLENLLTTIFYDHRVVTAFTARENNVVDSPVHTPAPMENWRALCEVLIHIKNSRQQLIGSTFPAHRIESILSAVSTYALQPDAIDFNGSESMVAFEAFLQKMVDDNMPQRTVRTKEWATVDPVTGSSIIYLTNAFDPDEANLTLFYLSKLPNTKAPL